MKALTIWQPWADAIAHGTKRVENRSWPAPAFLVGNRIAIHAGASYDDQARILGDLPDVRRAILAVVTLTGCHKTNRDMCCGLWGDENAWHWQLDDVHTLPEPVKCPGSRRLWTVPDDIEQAIRAQLPERAS